jgi:glycosyltransferase involved in cell wall biosynthesis
MMMDQSLDIALYLDGLPFTGDTLERQSLGGEQTAFIYTARELARLGHTVTAYCPCPKEGVFDGVTYKDVSKINELTERECDLFFCYRFLLVFTKPIRARVRVLCLQELLVESMNKYLTFLAPKIDIIYGMSEYHCRRTIQTVPELQSKVRRLMNAIDPLLVDETLAVTKEKKHKIMYTSRPERGLLQALDVYEKLQDTQLEFLICTYFFPQGGSVKTTEETCRKRIDSLIDRGFPIKTGSFAKRDLYRHIAESKVVIYPAQIPEVFCISAVETQALRTIFLTVDEFAFREVVGYEGVAYRDTAAFEEQLRLLLSDTELRQQLEEEGREHIQPYTWENAASIVVRDTQERLRLNATSEIAPRRNYDRRANRLPLHSGRLANALSSYVTHHLG